VFSSAEGKAATTAAHVDFNMKEKNAFTSKSWLALQLQQSPLCRSTSESDHHWAYEAGAHIEREVFVALK